MKQQYQAYSAATQTVATIRQIVMLYDGAIRYLQQAKIAMEGRNIEDRFKLLTKASNILFGLQSHLDFERGGSIAPMLYNFYASMDMRIFALHRSNSAEACDEVIADLKHMRDVWHEIDQGQAAELAAAAVNVPSAPAPVKPVAAPVQAAPSDTAGPVSLSA
jgi:flagellar protein FliS